MRRVFIFQKTCMNQLDITPLRPILVRKKPFVTFTTHMARASEEYPKTKQRPISILTRLRNLALNGQSCCSHRRKKNQRRKKP